MFREHFARDASGIRWFVSYHGIRLPWYALKILWWEMRGVSTVAYQLGRWGLDRDGHPLRGEIQAQDERTYIRMATDRTTRQKWRVSLVLSVLVVGALVVAFFLPSWLSVLIGVLMFGFLARIGRPKGATIVSPSITAQPKPLITTQLVVSALNTLPITGLEKALEGDKSSRIWRSGFADVRGGMKVAVQLPPGFLASSLLPHEDRLASAMRKPADTVIIEPKPDVTPGDFDMWIMNRPVFGGSPIPWPLRSSKRLSVFDPISLGIIRTGQIYKLALIEQNVFTGGIPGSGKSALVRVIAATAALDPLAILDLINLKGTPDFLALERSCNRYLSGNPDTAPEIVVKALRVLDEVKDDLGVRAKLLTEAARKGLAPDSKITRDLARTVPGLRPRIVIIDEAHRLFDCGEDIAKKAEELLTTIVKVGRAHGVILVLATQLGDADSVPPQLLRMASVRFCLRVGDHISMNQLMGNGASKALRVPTDFPPGVGYVRTATGDVKIKSYYVDGPALTDIAKRGLEARRTMNTLTGDAVGQHLNYEQADQTVILSHVLQAIPGTAPTGGKQDGDVAWLSELETVLTERPEYRDRSVGWLAPELRGRGVETIPDLNRRVPVSDRYQSGQRSELGVSGAAVRTALDALMDRHRDGLSEGASDGPVGRV